jgi:hypothetical protein
MNTPPETFPRLNINGTAADDLLKQQIDARSAVLDAMKALQAAAPNGRDYQTVSVDIYKAARQQHDAWLGQLDEMAQKLELIALAIHDQKTL